MAKACQVCLECGGSGTRLEFSSTTSVDYYRCEECGHVWVCRRGDPEARPIAVTYWNKQDGADER
jgi:hypothetical protein